jgi:hypothetical protein
MAEALKGMNDLVKTLNTIKDKSLKKATRAGINASLTPLTKAMRAAVNASSASTALKRAARKVIGKSLKKKRGTYQGKAGFAVGKQSKSKRVKSSIRWGSSKGGVGLSATNIHWFVLGTDDRETGSRSWSIKGGKRSRSTGNARRYTGKIDDSLSGLLGPAAASSGPAMLAAARKKIEQVLAREAAKARK